MAFLTLGKQTIDSSRCADPLQAIQAIQEIVEAQGNPAPAGPGDTIYGAVYYDSINSVLITNNNNNPVTITDIVVETNLTPGCGVTITNGVVAAAVDGTTIICEDGVLKATGTASVTLIAGEGISITGGDTINVDLAATDPCLEFDGSDDLQLQIKTDGGLERTSDGVQDKWRYHRATCLSTADYTNYSGDIQVDSASSVHGEDAGSSLTARGSLKIYAVNNCPLEIVFNNDGATDELDSWSYETAANTREILAGFDGYEADKTVLLGHYLNEVESLHQKFTHKRIGDWLATLPDYNTARNMRLIHVAGQVDGSHEVVRWVEGSDLRWGRAAEDIPAATSWLLHGEGLVLFAKDDGTAESEPVEVENWFFDEFQEGVAVCCDCNYTPPRIVSVGCTDAPEFE